MCLIARPPDQNSTSCFKFPECRSHTCTDMFEAAKLINLECYYCEVAFVGGIDFAENRQDTRLPQFADIALLLLNCSLGVVRS